MGLLDGMFGRKKESQEPSTITNCYYLGLKTTQDAANAVDELSFMKVLNKSTFEVQIPNDDAGSCWKARLLVKVK